MHCVSEIYSTSFYFLIYLRALWMKMEFINWLNISKNQKKLQTVVYSFRCRLKITERWVIVTWERAVILLPRLFKEEKVEEEVKTILHIDQGSTMEMWLFLHGVSLWVIYNLGFGLCSTSDNSHSISVSLGKNEFSSFIKHSTLFSPVAVFLFWFMPLNNSNIFRLLFC